MKTMKNEELLDLKDSGKTMHLDRFITGLFVVVFGALLLADGAIGYGWLQYTSGEIFSVPAMKLAIGSVVVVLALHLFKTSGK